MQRTKPPYRADQVGSFLRPAALNRAHARPRRRGSPQPVPPHTIELDLLDKRPLELSDALTHPHRSAGSLAAPAGHNSGPAYATAASADRYTSTKRR